MPGHVFITRADIRKLACDAWLIPCDERARPGDQWVPEGHKGPCEGKPFPKGARVQRWFQPRRPQSPWPWLGLIGSSGKHISWYVDGAIEFLEAAANSLVEEQAEPLFKRANHLLAIPVVGTGRGGAVEHTGAIVQELLPRLREFTQRQFRGGREFDVALVCFNAATHAAAQAERAHSPNWPWIIPEGLRNEADALAKKALNGNLALFLGAGVSVAAGLPNWGDLLTRLAEHAQFRVDEQEALLDMRSALDQATVIERRLQHTPGGIGGAVKKTLSKHNHYALSHALLASLPVREAITTNYDQLFETVWQLSNDADLSILPGKIKPETRRWLVKMHGCVSSPKKIVLTRESYTRYEEQLPTLSGMLQSLLITRHMLFVGFSLTDDNFHRIVDSVRRIRSGDGSTQLFGTSLALRHGGLSETLWEQDICPVSMLDRDETSQTAATSHGKAARRLEIFLDYLVSQTRSADYMLVGKRFDNLLRPGEQRLRDALKDFVKAVTGEHAQAIRGTIAWRRVEAMLCELGFDPESPPR